MFKILKGVTKNGRIISTNVQNVKKDIIERVKENVITVKDIVIIVSPLIGVRIVKKVGHLLKKVTIFKHV